MNKCEFYGGTEFVSATETKIKCKLMPDGGKVFENASEEGKETSLRCWHGGIDCPLKAGDGDNTGCTKEKQLSFEEAVETGITTVERDTAPFMEKAATLHRRILVNGKIAAESIVAMAKDLRVMNEEKLYTYLGCESFNDYCEQKVGIKQRHAYNFIKVLDKYGEQQLAEISHLGIAKLVELTALDEEDRQELIESGAAEEMSVRELKEKIKELESKCEQLTFDLESVSEEKNAAAESEKSAELLQQQINELTKAQEKLTAELAEKDKRIGFMEKSRVAKENTQRSLENSIKTQSETISTQNGLIKHLKDKISDLEAKVNTPSGLSEEQIEEYREEIRDEIRDEERERYEDELKAADERHRLELEKVRQAASAEAGIGSTKEKEELEKKHREELETIEKKHAEEIAALQSNAKSAPPDDSRERIKFYLGECQRAFNSALDAIKAVSDENIRTNFKDGMKKVVEQMGSAINA